MGLDKVIQPVARQRLSTRFSGLSQGRETEIQPMVGNSTPRTARSPVEDYRAHANFHARESPAALATATGAAVDLDRPARVDAERPRKPEGERRWQCICGQVYRIWGCDRPRRPLSDKQPHRTERSRRHRSRSRSPNRPTSKRRFPGSPMGRSGPMRRSVSAGRSGQEMFSTGG